MNIVELYLPLFAFVIMFFTFILDIFYRYVLNDPLTWTYEVKLAGYIWTTMLGACYIRRVHGHVSVDILYEDRSPLVKRIFRLIANSIVLAAGIIDLGPTYQYLLFMQIEKSSILRIPFNFIFLPVLIFIILISWYSLYDIIIDLSFFGKTERSNKP